MDRGSGRASRFVDFRLLEIDRGAALGNSLRRHSIVVMRSPLIRGSGSGLDIIECLCMAATRLRPMRALIFDLDGTLIDSKSDLIHAVNAMLNEMGRERLDHQTISGYIGHGAPMLVSRALGGNAKEEELRKGLQFFLAYYEEHKLDSTSAYPGVAETLAELTRKQMRMAVLTNKPVRISVRILEGLGLAKYFRVVYGGNSFETKKPDPFGANKILGEFGVAAGEAMMVGDSEVDVQTARHAGTTAVAVNYGFGIHDRGQYPADIYLDQIGDLLPLLG
jgi:phosphoglycolate phosphatase